MRRRWLILSILVLGLMTVMAVSGGNSSQAQDDSCPQIVDVALASVNQFCSDLDRNSACYGYNQVDATFNVDVPDFYFTQPADTAELLDLETLQTMPLTPDEDIWGLAVLNVQANLPNTLPGQGVVILLMGEAQIQNAVDPATAFIPADPIAITTLASASNIRTAPTTSAQVLGSVPAGTAFETDGRSTDGEWLRVIFDGRPAWVARSLIADADGLDALPSIQSGQYTPMQAFTFSTGIGQPTCSRAPNSIMIQGPENIDVTITANGADITIGSTIVLQTLAEDAMQVLAVSGSAVIDGVVVPAGFTVSSALDETGQAIPGGLSGFRPLSDSELENLQVLEDVNPNLLQYQVRVPTRAQILRLQNAITNRESAIAECRDAGYDAQQCLRIIGADGDLANRFQRCLDSRIPDNICRAIIGGDLNPQIVLRCLSEGYRTEAECRAAYQEATTVTLEDYCRAAGATTEAQCRAYCESQGYTTIESCQQAASETSSSTMQSDSPLMQFCQAGGATTLAQCRAYCQSLGYMTLEECQAAAESAASGGDSSTPSSDDDGGGDDEPSDPREVFCRSIGASTLAQCVQICTSNGYSSLEECMAGMG